MRYNIKCKVTNCISEKYNFYYIFHIDVYVPLPAEDSESVSNVAVGNLHDVI